MSRTPLITTSQAQYALGASWSPGGNSVAFAMSGGIWIVNRNGSGLRLLIGTQGSYRPRRARWSPDGQKLALALDDETNCPWFCDTAIGVINADGSGFKVLAKARQSEEVFLDSGFSGGPVWSPNGTRIAYDRQDCSGASCRSDVLVVDIDSGHSNVLLANSELIAR